MVANIPSLNNHILLYTHSKNDDLPLIQRQIEPVFKQFELLQSIEQLRNCIASDSSNILIVIYRHSLKGLIDTISQNNFNHITKVLIVDEEQQISPKITHPFDFVLSHDESLIPLLQQIVEFHQQKTEQHQNLQARIKELEKQLSTQKHQSDQVEILKEAIVRNVSHELKTPLLQVKSAVSLMAEDIGKENKLIRYAENATARLETIVNNITMFGSSLDMNFGPVIVRDAVGYAHRNIQRSWESKEQAKRITLHIDKDLPPVLADRQALSTILQLLLDNALKFSNDKIEVHAHPVDEQVEISVKDYGIGIDPDHINHIFDSFYQIDPSSTRRYGGTGVGLALVKLLIEKHDTEIKVTSEPEKGSIFSFSLKVATFQ